MRTIIALLILLSTGLLHAADKYTGWQSCATSGCHGGAGFRNQITLIPSQQGTGLEKSKDIHKGRAQAFGGGADPAAFHGLSPEMIKDLTSGETLKRYDAIAAQVGIKDYRTSAQCNVCHAPMKTVDAKLLNYKHPSGDVTCETCHGPAERWLLFHTRDDATIEQKISLGMRDLRTTYLRANNCVGCHANLPIALQKSQHPELRFELAQQMNNLPPHWQGDNDPAANWLTGQAVLLRELCWLAEKGGAPPELNDRIHALHWLLRETDLGAKTLPDDSGNVPPATLRAAADKLAKKASDLEWDTDQSRAFLDKCVGLLKGLAAGKPELQYRRAQVLSRAFVALSLAVDPKSTQDKKSDFKFIDDRLKGQEKDFHLDVIIDSVTKLRAGFAAK